MLVGLVGAVACYAWLFIMLGTSAFLPGAGGLDVASGAGHLACIVGVVAALFVSWAFSNALSAHRLVQFCLAAALAAAGCAGLWLAGGASPVAWVPALALGLGFGFLYPLYGELGPACFSTGTCVLTCTACSCAPPSPVAAFCSLVWRRVFSSPSSSPSWRLPPICSSWWCTGSTRARWWTAGNRTGVRAWCGAPTWRRSRRAWPPGSRSAASFPWRTPSRGPMCWRRCWFSPHAFSCSWIRSNGAR